MANLTDYLPAVMDGKNIQQPYNPGPSIFEGIAKLGSTVMEMQQGADKTNAAKEAAKRQATEDALKSSDRGAQNFAAEASVALSNLDKPTITQTAPTPGDTIPTPLTPTETKTVGAAVAAGNAIGQQATQLQAGVAQGRISQQQYEILMTQALQDGFAKFPDSKYVMMEALDKFAVDFPGLSQYRELKASNERNATAADTRDNEAVTFATEKGGMNPGLPRDQLIAAGYKLMSAEHKADIDWQLYQHQQQVNTDNRENLKANQETHDTNMGQYLDNVLGPQFSAGVSDFTTLMTDNNVQDPDKIKMASQFVNVFRPKAYAMIDQAILTAQARGMSQEAGDKERARLRGMVDNVFTQLGPDNPVNIIKTNGLILQNMHDKFGLDLEQAMPVFTRFKEALGSSDAVQQLIDQTASDPKLQQAFTREFKGFAGLVQGEQTTRINNLLAFISDNNTSLRSFSTDEAAQVVKDGYGALNGGVNGGLFKLAINGDPHSQRIVLNTIGKIANAAVDLPKGTSTAASVNAINMIANSNTLGVLNRLAPEHQEFGGRVADEIRYATQKQLINLSSQQAGDGYYTVKLNDHTHLYELVPTGKKAYHLSGGGTGFMKTEAIPQSYLPSPTRDVIEQVSAMNRGLKFLLASSSFEDDPKLKNASYEDKYRFYTKGEYPGGKSATADQVNSGERMSRLTNFWANIKVNYDAIPKLNADGGTVDGKVTINQDGSRSAPDLKGNPINIPSVDELKTKFSENPVFQSIVQNAQKIGVPEDLAIRLAHVETGGTFAAQAGSNRAGAYGPMQVVATKHNSEALEMFGRKVPDLTTDENIQLGLKILKDNLDRHKGDPVEAAHDYIGRGKDDGNISSETYAQLVGGS